MSDAPPAAGHNRYAGIDPEKLLVIDVEEIWPLLRLQYNDLSDRTRELTERALEWQSKHQRATGVAIVDAADMAATSDLYAQINDHAREGGEVDETRKKVKMAPFRACQAIDAHFKTSTEVLTRWLYTVTLAQRDYLREMKAREAREAAARADALRVEAEMAIKAAEAARTPEAIDMAMEADMRAETAQFHTPARKVTVRSALGTVTTAGSKWDFTVVDIRALCRAIADGKAPTTFVQPNDSAIRAAIRGKPPVRECDGLHIFEDVSIHRRGA